MFTTLMPRANLYCKGIFLSKSKNEIDLLATINQQPQVLIIGTHVIRLWASKRLITSFRENLYNVDLSLAYSVTK